MPLQILASFSVDDKDLSLAHIPFIKAKRNCTNQVIKGTLTQTSFLDANQYVQGMEYVLYNIIWARSCLKNQGLQLVWEFSSNLILPKYQLQVLHNTQWE